MEYVLMGIGIVLPLAGLVHNIFVYETRKFAQELNTSNH